MSLSSCKVYTTGAPTWPTVLTGIVLALLCFIRVNAAAGVLEHPHGRALNSKAPGFTAELVNETTSALKTVSGLADPNSNKDRKDGGSKKRPPKPGKSEQVPGSDDAVAPGTLPGGRKLHAAGRKLQAIGDPCSVYVKNACKSRSAFKAAFGYYTNDGVNSGFLSGWEATGWYNIKYGRKLKFSAWQTLYVLTLNGLKPSRTTGSSASFCVATFPFQILDGDDGNFYAYDGASNTYDTYNSCYEAGGFYADDFWAPAYCGVTIVYSNC